MPKNNSFTDIYDILNDYSKDISEGIHKIGDSVSKQGVQKLKNTTNVYHVRSGNYNKGWKVKTYESFWSSFPNLMKFPITESLSLCVTNRTTSLLSIFEILVMISQKG